MVALVPIGWAVSIHGTVFFFRNRVGEPFFITVLFALFPKSTGCLRRALDTVHCIGREFFFSGSPTTAGRVSESTLVRGSPASVYSLEHSYSTGVIYWHMYDIGTTCKRPRASDVPGTQYSVLGLATALPTTTINQYTL